MFPFLIQSKNETHAYYMLFLSQCNIMFILQNAFNIFQRTIIYKILKITFSSVHVTLMPILLAYLIMLNIQHLTGGCLMNWQRFGMKCSWPNLGTTQQLLAGTEKNHRTPQTGFLIPHPRFEPITPE
jgi:hypothetical protein